MNDNEHMARMREMAAAARAERVAQGLPANPSTEERLAAKPSSLRLAITCKCRDCSGLQDPDHRWRIANCEVDRCPLYPVRPYQVYFGRPMPDSLR